MKTLSVHRRAPHPMERMEDEWISEGEEVKIISATVNVPVEVIVQSGEVSGALIVMVKDSTLSD